MSQSFLCVQSCINGNYQWRSQDYIDGGAEKKIRRAKRAENIRHAHFRWKTRGHVTATPQIMHSCAEKTARRTSRRRTIAYKKSTVQRRIIIQRNSSCKNTFVRKSGWWDCSSTLSTLHGYATEVYAGTCLTRGTVRLSKDKVWMIGHAEWRTEVLSSPTDFIGTVVVLPRACYFSRIVDGPEVTANLRSFALWPGGVVTRFRPRYNGKEVRVQTESAVKSCSVSDILYSIIF